MAASKWFPQQLVAFLEAVWSATTETAAGLRASLPVPLDGGYPPGRFLIRLSVNALRRLAAR
jgi:hypothetical protein